MIYSNKEYSVFGNMCKTTDGDNRHFTLSRPTERTEAGCVTHSSRARPRPAREAAAVLSRRVPNLPSSCCPRAPQRWRRDT